MIIIFHTRIFFSLLIVLSLFENYKCIYDELLKYKTLDSIVELKGGEFYMGINDRNGVNYEHPQRKAIVEPFRIMLYPVSIASFRKYIHEKYKYKTTAETNGYSFVFDKLINKKSMKLNITNNGISLKELIAIKEARWNRPEGGDSSIKDRYNYPAVHVSYNDAFAYCTWKGMRLPTEIEWEFAARGGLQEKLYPWGDHWEVGRTNLWQGQFPSNNQMRDGFYGLAPVDAFKPQNQYEMYDMLGNIWEWTSTVYRDISNKSDEGKRKALKGGSFIDSRDGENNFNNVQIRISARIGLFPSYTAQNIGFRCAQTIENPKEYKKNNLSPYKVIRLRPPMHHRLNSNATKKTESYDLKAEL